METIYQFAFQFTRKDERNKIGYVVIDDISNNIQLGELFRQYQLSKTLAGIVQSSQRHQHETVIHRCSLSVCFIISVMFF